MSSGTEKGNKICGYEVHPAAALFPMMPEAELALLAESIKARGLHHPIIQTGDLILDGRNRLLACELAGVKPRFEYFIGDSPTAYVLDVNKTRRHLTKSQWAGVAVDSLPMFEAEAKERLSKAGGDNRAGKEKIPDLEKGQARDKAAAAVGVNPRYVSDAKKVKEEAPEIFEQMKRGEKTLAQAKAAVEARKPKPRKTPGSYEDWKAFRVICEEIDGAATRLAKLNIDSTHTVQARILSEKLCRKLNAITKQIGK